MDLPYVMQRCRPCVFSVTVRSCTCFRLKIERRAKKTEQRNHPRPMILPRSSTRWLRSAHHWSAPRKSCILRAVRVAFVYLASESKLGTWRQYESPACKMTGSEILCLMIRFALAKNSTQTELFTYSMVVLFVVHGRLVVTPDAFIFLVGLCRGHPLLVTVEGLFAILINEHVAPRGTDN